MAVNWSTLQEQNNGYFIVQRSVDGNSFANIDTTAAANVPHNYSYMDQVPLLGASYYRLVQVAMDGSTSYSDTMRITVAGDVQVSLGLRPNPSTGIVYLEMTNADQGKMEVSIADASGRPLRKWVFDKQGLNWVQAVNVGGLPAGTYYMNIRGPNSRAIRPFIKAQE